MNNHSHITQEAWQKISPSWPLQNIIACNPLSGFENLRFTDALKEAEKLFCNHNLPEKLIEVNEITIKWCKVFFDKGQATISMPNKLKGFYLALKELMLFDEKIHKNSLKNIDFIKNLPSNSAEAINVILTTIYLDTQDKIYFLTILLTTLSGWASYVKYLGDWSYDKKPNIKDDYLAIRLIITILIDKNLPQKILNLKKQGNDFAKLNQKIKQLEENEELYSKFLFNNIAEQNNQIKSQKIQKYDASFVFCIDVRSESIRRAIESLGNYNTFGFAGFFGVPINVVKENNESYASCPVLLTPKHNVFEKTNCLNHNQITKRDFDQKLTQFRYSYQVLKYNFLTPLPLAEGFGFWHGLNMLAKTFLPKTYKTLQNVVKKIAKQNFSSSVQSQDISMQEQFFYAVNFLKSIGLISNFAKQIVLCGHGSQTENNAFATSLDCGACGGRHGDNNAKILAKILNQKEIRKKLQKAEIIIPKETIFIAAKHNTTTDKIQLYFDKQSKKIDLTKLKQDLAKAKKINNKNRIGQFTKNNSKLSKFFFNKSHSWCETRPEWGLVNNASFIVAPRYLTKNINLSGRAFLHSYDWQLDKDLSILNTILTAPMIVAYWINSQYLFSTLNNVAFGSGNKITQNIVGKIGVMQGNGSDLMTGLPLQSVYVSDTKPQHQINRLISVVYAPKEGIYSIITKNTQLQNLIKNEWIKLYCLNPEDQKISRIIIE